MGRNKLNKANAHYRVKLETMDLLNKMAIALGYKHGSGGAVGEMLDAIADGNIILVQKSQKTS